MKSSVKEPGPGVPANPPTVRFSEVLLRSEVSFWREMLSRDTGSLPPESVERIRQALALAEYRLLGAVLEPAGPAGTSDGRESTSPPEPGCLH